MSPSSTFGWHNDKPVQCDTSILVLRLGNTRSIQFRRNGETDHVSIPIESGDVYTLSYSNNSLYSYFSSFFFVVMGAFNNGSKINSSQ